MRRKILDKLRYYQAQEGKFVDKYLETTRRQDRDTLLRVRTRLSVYREVLEIMDAEKLKDE